MKKIVSAFAFFICVLLVKAQDKTTATQPNQWEIINTYSKGDNGKLIIYLPVQATMMLTVARAGEAKNLFTWHGANERELPPGKYDVSFWGIKIPSVVVQKGMDTRIFGGVLNSTVKGLWDVWTLTGEKLYTAGSPKQVALPPGTYLVKTGGAEIKSTIRDGKITMFSFTKL